MFSFILLIVVIILAVENNKLSKEVKELKKKTQISQTSEKTVVNNITTAKEQEKVYNVEQVEKTLNKEIKQETTRNVVKTKSAEQTKNTLILVAGAILIVLAAIVFLSSTWDKIPDIIKTGTLVLLIGVFLGASYLAKNKLKLELSAKTFYYIAMAYIPIVMFSISVFELFGHYFSIYGEGNYIYFSICSIVLTAIYLLEAIIHYKKTLSVFGLFFGMLAVIFTVLVFTTGFYKVLFGILFYTLLISLITKYKDLEQFNLEYLYICGIVLSVIVSVITISATSVHWVMGTCKLIDILNMFALTSIFFIMQKENSVLRFLLNIGILFTTLTFVNIEKITFDWDIKYFIMSLATVIVYLVNYSIYKKVLYKVVTYLSLNSLALSLALVFDVNDFIKYIPFLTTIIIMLIELLDRTENIKYYLVVSFAITFMLLNIETTAIGLICLIVDIALFIMHIKNENLNEWNMIIPLIGIMPNIFSKTDTVIHSEMVKMFICSLAIITTTGISVLKKHINVYLIASMLYIIFITSVFKMNIYVFLILTLIWSLVHAMVYNKKDGFKAIAYITTLALFNKVLDDLDLESYIIVYSMGYLACLYLITRTILVKYIKEYKVLEYIFTSIIYLYVLGSYVGIADSMIFITFLFICVVLGYMKKVGPLFLTSLIAIVLNGFRLTQDFWYSIPWWVYMLFIGSALILFAMRNEISENNNKGKIKETIRKLKDNVDL